MQVAKRSQVPLPSQVGSLMFETEISVASQMRFPINCFELFGEPLWHDLAIHMESIISTYQ